MEAEAVPAASPQLPLLLVEHTGSVRASATGQVGKAQPEASNPGLALVLGSPVILTRGWEAPKPPSHRQGLPGLILARPVNTWEQSESNSTRGLLDTAPGCSLAMSVPKPVPAGDRDLPQVSHSPDPT